MVFIEKSGRRRQTIPAALRPATLPGGLDHPQTYPQ
jgi:hypothetical protein